MMCRTVCALGCRRVLMHVCTGTPLMDSVDLRLWTERNDGPGLSPD